MSLWGDTRSQLHQQQSQLHQQQKTVATTELNKIAVATTKLNKTEITQEPCK